MEINVVGSKIDRAKIKVVGVGGGGGNAVIHMINHDIKGVDFICANTDTQALSNAKGAITLKLGNGVTNWKEEDYNEEVKKCARMWPHHNDTDAFFLARMEKC